MELGFRFSGMFSFAFYSPMYITYSVSYLFLHSQILSLFIGFYVLICDKNKFTFLCRFLDLNTSLSILFGENTRVHVNVPNFPFFLLNNIFTVPTYISTCTIELDVFFDIRNIITKGTLCVKIFYCLLTNSI